MMNRAILPAVRLHAEERKTARDALLFAVEREILTRHERIDMVDVLCPYDTFRCVTRQIPALRVVHGRRIVNRQTHVRGAAIRTGDTFGDFLHASRHIVEPLIRLTPERPYDLNLFGNDTRSIWITAVDRGDRHHGRGK